MSRLDPVSPETLTPEQRRMYDIIASTRKGLGGPFSVWVRTPALAEPANMLHNAFRLHGTLDRRLFEMLILLVSHEYGAKYVWTFHVAQALKAGLANSTVDAIREDRRPDFAQPDEPLIYDTVIELLKAKTLSDSAYAKGLAVLGLELLIEVVSAVGFYAMISTLVNTFDVPEPGKNNV